LSKFLARRLIQIIPTLLVIFTVLFILAYLMPGDPLRAKLGEEYERIAPEVLEQMKEDMGLNRPFVVQYVEFLGQMVRFDLGTSMIYKQPVIDIIGYRFPRTLQLMLGGMLVSLMIGIPAGIVSAVKQYSWIDNALMLFALIGVSMPVFWQALIMQLFLTQEKYGVALFPVAGFGGIEHMILPSLVLGTNLSAIIARVTRSAMLDVVHMDYIKTARSKGLPEWTVLMRHQIRNALIPVVTVIGLQIAGLMTGSLVTETVFNWPGLGRAIVPAIQNRDTPVIMGVLMFGALAYIVVNLITDLLYALIDPRVRYAKN
jgi:peptide/nickel transport system permease protein